MALSSQTKTDNLNESKNEQSNENQIKNQGNIQNGTSESTSSAGYCNKSGAMNEQKAKSPNGSSTGGAPEHPPVPYGEHHPHSHGQMGSGPPEHHGPPHSVPTSHGKQDEMLPGNAPHQPQMPYGPPPMHQQYPRYHHDPNMPPNDPYGHYRQLPPGGKPGSMIPPNRPPQRYMPGPPPPGPPCPPGQQQGPTPTLNSLLQSQPPPHRYPNSYDPNQQQAGPPPPQQGHPPPPPQSGYGQAGGWSQPQPPRPYSPQMGPQQSYRPPPGTPPRGQSPYPPVPNQQPPPGAYPPGPPGQPPQSQSPGGPPPPSQYPYPQRYPTSPGTQQAPNHRSAYPPHQYPEPNRSWPSPTASPGPGGLPPPSPHGPPQSPSQAPHGALCPSPQPPQSAPSPHQYPSRPSQSSTPVTNDGDTIGDTTGQNSNDSSSGAGAAPGTPNSQGMRPTPSPTGSSGSRSMSPAIGQQSAQMPPRPSSSHSQVPNQTTTNNSSNNNLGISNQQSQPPHDTSLGSPGRPPSSSNPAVPPSSIPPPNSMAAQGSYQAPPPHMHGYKSGPQGMSPYPPSQQYSQPNYPSRGPYPGQYGPAGQPPPPNSMPPGQYPGRPMPNHVAQYPPYPQNWGPPQAPPPQGAMMTNHVPKPGQQGPGGPPRQGNYLKQHLKGSYPPSGQPSTPPQGYGNGPGMHPPMGPPHHMGPPMGSMGPPPPTTAPNQPPNSHPDGMPPHQDSQPPQDNGVPVGPHPVTSIVTTGPDGTTLDEASQQSTLSNASAASGEDPQCSTPKSRKTDTSTPGPIPYQNQNHLPPPTPSPGALHHSEDYEMGSSPQWQGRTPAASPVFNTHVPQEPYRSPKVSAKKSDSIAKLYEMDDNPERKGWLDKLISFMEERRTPITACPTISKQALDLYRLYLYVKERGGFVEVCKVSKSKTWKDVAGLLGIGASSSAAYTLRKHYTKNILPFECQFDRGGIDPGPIAQSIETGSKKKAAKATSVPSPGSSNSQDSFPPPGSSGGSMDGYGQPYPGQQGPPPAGYSAQPVPTPEYNQQPMPRPPSQSNAQAPHPGTGAPPTATGDNISASNPFDDPVGPPRPPYQQGAPYPPVSRPQGAPYQQQQQPNYQQYSGPEGYGPAGGPPPPNQYPPQQGQFPPSGRQMYPPYGGAPPSESDSSVPPPAGSAPPTSTDPYRSGYPPQSAQGPYPPPPGPPRGPYPPPPQQQPPISTTPTTTPPTGPGPQQTAATVQPTPPPGAYPQGPPPQSDYYRQPEPTGQPRRHPDFTKEPQPYPAYGPGPQRPQMYGGWPPNNQGQYPRAPSGPYPPQQAPPGWQASGPRPSGPPGGPVPPQQGGPGPQWGGDRFPPNQQSPYPHQSNQQQWGPQGPPGSAMRAPPRGGKPYNMPPPQGAKPIQGPFPQPGVLPKREIVFPPDSIEATTPIMMRRKRLCRGDIGVTDPWRVFMALRSGLLHETTWALDVLNILLFDDSAVAYFGLNHMPGLLNLLLEHFQKSLFDVFEPLAEDCKDIWYCYKKPLKEDETQEKKELAKELGAVVELPRSEDRVEILRNSANYTMQSRKGLPVKMNSGDEDIFVTDDIRKWDRVSDPKYQSTTTIGCDAWSAGQTDPDPYDYIMDTFAGEFVNIPFAKYIKNSKTTVIKKETIVEESKKTAIPNPNKTKVVEENPVEIVKKTISKMNKENNRLIQNNLMVEAKKENGEIKRESSDADLRQIDMELERIPNGPTSNGSGQREKEENLDTEEEKGFDIVTTAKDPAKVLKRRHIGDYEDECYTRDEASLFLITESQDVVARRCICLSNILRNLTFVPGNEMEFARSEAFLAILGKLLLFHHDHLVRAKKTRNYDREEDADFTDSCSSLQGENEWWWEYLIQIRENMLVATANISGHMDLSTFGEDISRPVLDGLLHWAVCPAAHGQDPFPTCGPLSNLSPQRLALEALCKLCVTDANVDLVIATPPFSRLEKLCSVLTRHLCRNEDQVLREFSVNLLHYLAAADSTMARTIAMQSPCVSYLVAFIEQAEQTALGVANQHGINFLRETPDSMGTSLDMLRRSAGTLLHLARHPDNRPLFMQQEQRLLGLVMSHILDQQVASIISRVLFQCSRGPGPLTTAELLLSQRPSNRTTVAPTTIITTTAASAAATAATTTMNVSALSPKLLQNEAQAVHVSKEDLSLPSSTDKITTLEKSVTAPSLQREPISTGSS